VRTLTSYAQANATITLGEELAKTLLPPAMQRQHLEHISSLPTSRGLRCGVEHIPPLRLLSFLPVKIFRSISMPIRRSSSGSKFLTNLDLIFHIFPKYYHQLYENDQTLTDPRSSQSPKLCLCKSTPTKILPLDYMRKTPKNLVFTKYCRASVPVLTACER
jgi:hypothetical protein